MCSHSPFSLPIVLRKCYCRLGSMLKTLEQDVEIMSCSGGSGGAYGNEVDMKGDPSLAGATATVCWRRFQNKNPKPQHMFPAVPRDFMTHPSPTGMDATFIYLFHFFHSPLPSPPLHSAKCGIIYSTARRGAGSFSISIYLSGFGGMRRGFQRVITLFFPNC